MSDTRQSCSCGRAPVEFGCDLCHVCRGEYEERQYGREMEARYAEEQQREYEAWLNTQGPS